MSSFVAKNWAKEPITKDELTRMSQGIADAHTEIDTKAGLTLANVFSVRQTFQGGVQDGDGNQDYSLLFSLGIPIDTRSWTATAWTAAGKPTHIDIKNGAAVVGTVDITYDVNTTKPTQVVAVAGGKTITYTINWTGQQFNGYTKVVV